MHVIRQQLPRFAALVLLLWLLVSGVAFAHACQSKIHLDCDACCAEMKASGVLTATPAAVPAAAQAALPVPPATAAPAPAWQPTVASAPRWSDPPDPGGTDIPIVFLRLAL